MYNNETALVCDEDCKAVWEGVGEAVEEGAKVVMTAIIVWCLIIVCVPTIIITLIICISCWACKRCDKNRREEEKAA